MFGRTFSRFAVLATCLVVTGGVAAADLETKAPTPSKGFYEKFLTPRMNSRLTGEINAASVFRDANVWTRDDETVERIEKASIRAAKGALKRYALEGLQLDEVLTVPLSGGHGGGIGAVRDDSGGARLRFGISHLTPRADVLIPSTHGRVVVTFDARGRVGTRFESHAMNFNFGVSYDPSEGSGAFALSRRF